MRIAGADVPVEGEELSVGAVLVAIGLLLVGVLVGGLVVAAVARALGGRRFGFGSALLGIVISIASLVDVIVVNRVVDGVATRSDLLWAAVLSIAAAASAWVLLRRVTSGDSALDA